MFFRPNFVQKEHGQGMTMVLNGLIRDHSQKRDRFMNTDLTDHLFQTKDGRSLDLASLNIQRGRDHGLPSYNSFRKFCGLPSLQEVMATGKMADAPFLRVYNNLDDVDLFTGGLAETPVPGGVVGPTFSCIIGQQFHNIKFGDRFWYQNTQHEGAFTLGQIQAIERIGLSDVLCWVTSMSAVQVQPFVEPSVGNPVRECFETLPLDLSPWLEI
ncbi:hypothetical protein V1264_013088 [Littorina saxatilis]|uniref:Uncharacterized protein n=2 Tax=Littorina saxatilis TaxID=31220 RepID=A0AAN9BMF0_9CAEN